MKKILFYILLMLLLFTVPAFSATYHIKQSATGDESGSSEANADSVAAFNADTINDGATGMAAGDTIYFYGTITSTITPPVGGSGGTYITLDGGDIGGTYCTIDRANGDYGISISGLDYIKIQDFKVADFSLDGIVISSAGSGVNDGCDYITVKDCIVDGEGTGARGIVTRAGSTDTWNTYITIGGASGDGNEVHGIVVSPGIDVAAQRSYDVIISYNKLYGSASDGVDGILTERTKRLLIEYNTIYNHNLASGIEGEDGIDLKHETNDAIVRFNNIYDNTYQNGLAIQKGTHHTYVYGNRFKGSGNADWSHISVMRGTVSEGFVDMTDIYIWANLIYSGGGAGINISKSGWDGDPTITGVHIYNNTIASNCDNHTYANGVVIRAGDNHEVKNNLFYINGSTNHYQLMVDTSSVTGWISDYNTYYFDGDDSGDDLFNNDGTARTFAEWQALGAAYDTNSGLEDPGFTDAGSNDYTLDGTNINDGADLSQQFQVTVQGTVYTMNLNIGLDPNETDFTTTPPTVETLVHTAYGTTDRGAYVYTPEGTSAPVITNSADGLTNSCPNGADPINANFWLWTDIASYCKGGIKSTTCAGDYADGYDDAGLTTYDNPGTTAHGLVLSVACGSAHTVCAVCSDISGAGGNETAWEEITRTVDAEEGLAESYPVVLYNDTSGKATTTLYNDASGKAQVTLY